MARLEQLVYTLLAYINNSLEKDINYSIATSLLENINKIVDFTLETASDACNVSPSTFNRFCRRIGYKNFSTLRNSIVAQHDATTKDEFLSTRDFEIQLKENVEMMEAISENQMERIITGIHQSEKIIILGFEKHQIHALELQKKLFLLGKICECSTNFFKQIDSLKQLSDGDLVITISIQGNILMDDSITKQIQTAKGKKGSFHVFTHS